MMVTNTEAGNAEERGRSCMLANEMPLIHAHGSVRVGLDSQSHAADGVGVWFEKGREGRKGGERKRGLRRSVRKGKQGRLLSPHLASRPAHEKY